MGISPEQAYDIINTIVSSHKIEKMIETVEHRSDYGDYRVTLIEENFQEKEDEPWIGRYHCEIREKLIDVLIQDPDHGDTIREVAFNLNNAMEFTEYD